MKYPVLLHALFLFVFSFNIIPAQTNYYSPENIKKFAQNLYENENYELAVGEYLRAIALKNTDEKCDSLYFRIALSYCKLRQPDNIRKFCKLALFDSSDSRIFSEVNYLIAYSFFIEKKYDSTQNISTSLFPDTFWNSQFKIMKIASMLKQFHWQSAIAEANTSLQNINDSSVGASINNLMNIGIKGTKLSLKSPSCAVIMSAVIPGSGKAYCGRMWDGLYSFLVVAAMSWQSYEGFSKNGISSGRGISFGLLGLIFYGGNILGSFNAAKLYNISKQSELVAEVNPVISW
jgi:tetratricopeptide (TPR) repeat protein